MKHHGRHRVHIPVIHAALPAGDSLFTMWEKEIMQMGRRWVVQAVQLFEASAVSEKGKLFIKSWEQGPEGLGLPALKVYDDADAQYKEDIEKTNPALRGRPRGFWTIGYGHLITPGENFDRGITSEVAEQLFEKDLLRKSVDIIYRNVKAPLGQQQLDALASYIYNTGSLRGTKLLAKINALDMAGAVLEMDIITSNGVPLEGLRIRRNNERNMWLNGIYENHH